jgi:hypothetical protein
MTREQFEEAYAYRHMPLSFMHNQFDAVDAVKQQRDGDTYSDQHIADCWNDEQAGRSW